MGVAPHLRDAARPLRFGDGVEFARAMPRDAFPIDTRFSHADDEALPHSL